MKNYLTPILLLSLFTSCGGDSSNGDGAPPSKVVSQTIEGGQAIFYPKLHSTCTNTQNSFGNLFSIDTYINQRVEELDHSFEGRFVLFPKMKSRSSLISKVLFNKHTKYEYDFSVDSYGEPKFETAREILPNLGLDMFLCHDQLIEDSSLEKVSVDTLYSLDAGLLETEKMLNTYFPSKIITPITLSLNERIDEITKVETKDKVYTYKSTMTDNAYYMPNVGISILPQSVEARSGRYDFTEVPLWQLSFVSTHEYGHHIYGEFFKKSYESEFLKRKGHRNCFSPKKEKSIQERVSEKLKKVESKKGHKKQQFAKVSYAYRETSVADVLGALNEGFADIYSHYMNKGNATTRGITCLGKTRDVTNNKFDNGALKELDYSAINKFFSLYEYSVETCSEPNYQDDHHIGAIIANGFYRLLNEQTSWDESKKTSILLKWLENLNSNYENHKDDSKRTYLKFSVTSFVKTYLDSLGQVELTKEQNNILAKVFTEYYYTRW